MRLMHLSVIIDAVMDDSEARAAGLVPLLAQFAVLAKVEHMTVAASRLGVPQSTLSRRVARLETALETELFVRRGRTIELTPAGRGFAQVADRALHELEGGVRELTQRQDAESGTVALGFLHTLGPEVVPQLVKAFRRDHPGIRFQLTQDAHEVVLEKLRAGEVDLCLTSPLPDEQGLAVQPLQKQPLCLTVPSGHRLAGRRTVRLAEVAAEPFVGFKPFYGMRGITDAWCRQAGFTPELAFEGEDVQTLRGLVAAGLGIVLLPPAPHSTPIGVIELAVQSPRPTRTIGVTWLTRHLEWPPAQLFREFLLRSGSALLRDTSAG